MLRVTQLTPIRFPEGVSTDPRFLPHRSCLQCSRSGVFASTHLCPTCHVVARAAGHPPDSVDERRPFRELNAVRPDADDWLIVCRGSAVDPDMAGYFVDALVVNLGATWLEDPPWTVTITGREGPFVVLRYRFWRPDASSYLMVWMDPVQGEQRQERNVEPNLMDAPQAVGRPTPEQVGRGRPKDPRYLDAEHFRVAFEAAYRTCAKRLVKRRPLLSVVASELGMSPRTLSRELRSHGFRYRDLTRIIVIF